MDAAAVWTENSHFRGRPLEHDETRASCVFGKSIKYPKAATDSPCDLGPFPEALIPHHPQRDKGTPKGTSWGQAEPEGAAETSLVFPLFPTAGSVPTPAPAPEKTQNY
ncbi:hypothetical protein MG293_016418 [Ovis ammon polii]|uniref:Uncharacterized protein n=1 Tax=Ovis ammon polii TaxID=230172 RepID=A0AAD4TW13_OVIAM|nr:hypothetical protein MG293_016418 [Ovis ammon polii]